MFSISDITVIVTSVFKMVSYFTQIQFNDESVQHIGTEVSN